MEKITFAELSHIFTQHNKDANITSSFTDKDPLTGVIVFSQNNFKIPYSTRSRSYQVQSDNKYFIPGLIGASIFGDCLDGTDQGVRLDWYMKASQDPWEVEYCYIVKNS